MFTVYILFSTKRNSYYAGYTSEKIEERIRKHISNHSGFTGGIDDWKLLHSENFDKKSNAIMREKEIKNWKSRKMLEKLIADGASRF